uniref:Retrotransposon gag domain-containing protein n=1 Tax=Nicotiana tabacum TaxID=4097 RepID=A0A1S3ZRV2_TOBAC|nr:PREDICTED: uncharacterized protein LOC107789669 [Nicotiana tabacum]
MVENEEIPVIEAARPSLVNMTQAIVKLDIIGHFELKQYMTKVLKSQILGFQQGDGETLRQAWERYKKLLRDCSYRCQTDEVLGHTFVDGPDETSKLNLDSACGGSCMQKPYSKIQTLLNNFTANNHNWQGKGDARRMIKQKAVGTIKLDEMSAMRAEISKLTNQVANIEMGQGHQMQQSRGPMKQNAQYVNTYNPNWRNYSNLSWGENQASQNQYRPKENYNHPERSPQQVEESTNNMLKKLLIDNQQLQTDNQQLRTGFQNIEKQITQLAALQNTRPTGALPSNTDKNPHVNALTLRNGRELEEIPKIKKVKVTHKGELVPQTVVETEKEIEESEKTLIERPPPPFP